MGWTQQEPLREIGRCPRRHQHPGGDNVSEMGTACSKVPSDTSHLGLHTAFLVEHSPPPSALLDSSVRKFILILAPRSLLLALALIPGASENVPGTTPQGSHGPGHLHASQPRPPAASLPKLTQLAPWPEQTISGVGGRSCLGCTSVPLQLCSLSL